MGILSRSEEIRQPQNRKTASRRQKTEKRIGKGNVE